MYSAAIEAMTILIAERGSVPRLCEVADRIQVDVTDLKAVVPDVEALMHPMAENAMILLHHTCVQKVVKTKNNDPVEQFAALADGYVEWGYSYPREFRIIGAMPAGTFEANRKLLRYEESIHELMIRILQRARAQSLIPPDHDLQTLVAIAHTYAYGVISKMLLGDLERWNPGLSGREAARQNLRLFINQFLRRGPTIDPAHDRGVS